MKTHSFLYQLWRGSALSVLVFAVAASVSCMTTYDAHGRPVQSVDPGVAVAGAAAAGLAGYALANSNDRHYRRGYYGGGYGGYGGYYRRPHYRHY